MSAIDTTDNETPVFDVYRIESVTNRLAVESVTANDDRTPIAFRDDMREFGALMAVGDTLTLGRWHYAIRVA